MAECTVLLKFILKITQLLLYFLLTLIYVYPNKNLPLTLSGEIGKEV
jgi:hypothetical protein